MKAKLRNSHIKFTKLDGKILIGYIFVFYYDQYKDKAFIISWRIDDKNICKTEQFKEKRPNQK